MDANPGYELIGAVVGTANVFQRESQRLFRPHGISAAQFNVLNLLGATPEGQSQRELSDALVVDRSNITGLLDRMEEAGWVKRMPVPGDRRAHRVVLTVAGRKLWDEILPRYLEVVAQVTAGLKKAEMAASLGVLRHLELGAAKWSLPEAK